MIRAPRQKMSMRNKDKIINQYFEWMYDIVCAGRYSKEISYRKLLMHLHNTEFTYLISHDENRADDGIDLRYRFAKTKGYRNSIEEVLSYLAGPCSVLEMMVALSIRCEENIMDDPAMGDRTSQWFWGMIVNLGLGSMMDDRYDKWAVEQILTRFLNRDYDPDGKGGLFTIKHCDRDLRTAEIWYQLCWYLDSIA